MRIIIAMSLAAIARSARVAAMRARALRSLPPRPLAEQVWRAARIEHIQTYGGNARRFSEYCRLARKMAIVRAYAALAMVRSVGGRVWRQHARDAIRDAAHWRRSAADAVARGR